MYLHAARISPRQDMQQQKRTNRENQGLLEALVFCVTGVYKSAINFTLPRGRGYRFEHLQTSWQLNAWLLIRAWYHEISAPLSHQCTGGEMVLIFLNYDRFSTSKNCMSWPEVLYNHGKRRSNTRTDKGRISCAMIKIQITAREIKGWRENEQKTKTQLISSGWQ